MLSKVWPCKVCSRMGSGIKPIKEVVFASQILTTTKIQIQYSILSSQEICEQNLWPKTLSVSHTKNVDIRYKFETKYVEDGTVKIIFVTSTENNTDIFTKTLNWELHETYSSKIVKRKYPEGVMMMITKFTFGKILNHQVKEHCDAIRNHMQKLGMVLESGKFLDFLKCWNRNLKKNEMYKKSSTRWKKFNYKYKIKWNMTTTLII